jgi:hypothetical protein
MEGGKLVKQVIGECWRVECRLQNAEFALMGKCLIGNPYFSAMNISANFSPLKRKLPGVEPKDSVFGARISFGFRNSSFGIPASPVSHSC